MSDLIDREAVQREIQNSFDAGAFRWQDGQDLMDRINALPAAPRWVRCEEPPKEEGKYWIATKSVVRGWVYETAWYTKNLEHAMLEVPVPENTAGWYNWDGYNDCDVEVHPDYWMPIEPPKEDA